MVGRQPIILANFFENCMKMIKHRLSGGASPWRPFLSANVNKYKRRWQQIMHNASWTTRRSKDGDAASSYSFG